LSLFFEMASGSAQTWGSPSRVETPTSS
jgi:hypothetical protein